MEGFTLILSLLSGVALFLYGMSLMGDGLKKAAGEKLELILYRLTNTPLKGILLGTAVTAIIQSSSATTVMVVGFVNAGMMKVSQAIGIIMGANIGTSITGWILCLSYIEGTGGIAQLLSTATISAVVAVIGIIFKMFLKKASYHNVGDIMLGFSILMTGMQMMSSAVSPLKSNAHCGRHFVYGGFTECFGVCRYSAGVIRDRRHYVCGRAADYDGDRRRRRVPGTAFFDWYE